VGALVEALGIQLEPAVLPAAGRGMLALPHLGAGSTVESLVVSYEWGIHHEEPIATLAALRACRLWDWTAGFGAAIADVEAALTKRFREPRAIEGGLVAGSLCLFRREQTLSWYSRLPDALLPAPDPARRHEALRALLAALATGGSPLSVPLPAEAGLEGRRSGASFTITFTPAILASELVALASVASPVGQPSTIQPDAWEIRAVVGGDREGPVTEPPKVGAFRLRPVLVERPTGGPFAPPTTAAPPGGTFRLGPTDGVRLLEIARARG
jgi:hypothetical protein